MRKSSSFLLLLLGVLLLPVTAFGQSIYSDTYVIPVVAHTPGQGGTFWESDVAITNFSSSLLTVQLVVVETGETNRDNIFPLINAGNTGSVSVPAGRTVLLRDILSGYRAKESSSGALILGGDHPFAVTSRLYDSSDGGSSIGQTVTPARDFFENSTGRPDNSAVAVLPGLVSNASTRSNVGFLAGTGNASTGAMTVEIRVKSAAGTTLGTRSVSIPAGNFTHVQFSVASITNTPFDIGSVELRVTGGQGTIVPYASVVDNATGNAAYIMGQFPDSTALSGLRVASKNIFRELLDRMNDRGWTTE